MPGNKKAAAKPSAPALPGSPQRAEAAFVDDEGLVPHHRDDVKSFLPDR
jgi:hypothetical protein